MPFPDIEHLAEDEIQITPEKQKLLSLIPNLTPEMVDYLIYCIENDVPRREREAAESFIQTRLVSLRRQGFGNL